MINGGLIMGFEVETDFDELMKILNKIPVLFINNPFNADFFILYDAGIESVNSEESEKSIKCLCGSENLIPLKKMKVRAPVSRKDIYEFSPHTIKIHICSKCGGVVTYHYIEPSFMNGKKVWMLQMFPKDNDRFVIFKKAMLYNTILVLPEPSLVYAYKMAIAEFYYNRFGIKLDLYLPLG